MVALLKRGVLGVLLLTSTVSTSAITAVIQDSGLQPRATASSTTCAADNCLRALSNAYTSTASAFCNKYTATLSQPIPAYATSGCASNPSRVSSACTCLATSYGQPKPFRKVYGPMDNTTYTIYEEALNIRSDPGSSGTYNQYLQNCQNLCNYTGNGCQTYSFEQLGDGGNYLCYVYAGTYDPSKVMEQDGTIKDVVYERYQN